MDEQLQDNIPSEGAEPIPAAFDPAADASATLQEPAPLAAEFSSASAPATEIAADASATLQEPAAELSPAAVPLPVRRTAERYLIFAAIAVAGIFIVHLFRFLKPLFDRVYYKNLTELFLYICNIVFYVPFLIVLYKQVKKHTGYRILRRDNTHLSLKRSLIIYACAIVPIFIVSAALGFELKIVDELGKRVSVMQLATNGVMYGNGAAKLLLYIAVIELVQEAAEVLYPGKYTQTIPWGGIVLMLLVGLPEVLAAHLIGTRMLYAWLYVAFDLLYGGIYLLAKKNFLVTYFVSLIIYIL